MEAIIRRADGKHVLLVGLTPGTLDAMKVRPLEEHHAINCDKFDAATPPIDEILIVAAASEEHFVNYLTTFLGPEKRRLFRPGATVAKVWRAP